MEQPRRQGQPAGGRGPSDELILAAVRRAVLHAREARGGATLRAVLAHLSVPRRTARARALAGRLAGLERSGELARTTAHGVAGWSLTAAGERRLAAALRTGWAPALPEAPQHAAWRQARASAGQELGGFMARLAADLAEADAMLAAIGGGSAPHSDRWLALGRRLLGDCRRLGSAWHCLHEWPEPDDARADHDEPRPDEPGQAPALRAGRRNIALWAEPD